MSFEPMYTEPEQTDEQRLEQLKEKAYEHLRSTIRHGIAHLADPIIGLYRRIVPSGRYGTIWIQRTYRPRLG